MGVIMVACFTTIAISFMPPRAVRRVFPPMISGITIFCELLVISACERVPWILCCTVINTRTGSGPADSASRCPRLFSVCVQ
jgi:hypothetical protein